MFGTNFCSERSERPEHSEPVGIFVPAQLNLKGVAGGHTENNNRIEFIVRREATKKDIKAAIETLLEVKVSKVNVRINRTGKHASIRLADGYDAEEAALKLGAF
jgi:large subunit ribosomal protein L23